jgi:hypothetical protein
LTQLILNSTQKVKDKFRIIIEKDEVISFQGEAIVLRAIKK